MSLTPISGLSYTTGLTTGTGITRTGGLTDIGESAPINTNPRNIASGVRIPTGMTTAAVNTSNCISFHFNESNVAVARIKLIYPGWYLTTANETAAPNNYTVASGICLTVDGTFEQVLYDAAASGTVVAGTNKESDWYDFAIPPNTGCFIRTHAAAASGAFVPTCPITPDTGNGEAGERNTDLENKSLTGSISGTALVLRPAAIVSEYVNGMISVSMCAGFDSTPFGAGDGSTDSHSNTSFCGRAATSHCPYILCAITGATISTRDAAGEMDMFLDFLSKAGVTHFLSSGGANDVGVATYAQLIAAADSVWGQIQALGIKVIPVTTGPRSDATVVGGVTIVPTDNTDEWFNHEYQDPSSGWDGSTSDGQKFNDYIRSKPPTTYDYFDKCLLISTSIYSSIFINGEEDPNIYMLPASTLTVTGTPTTTVFSFTPALPTGHLNYFSSGMIEVLTGVNAGLRYYATITNTASAITLGTALDVALEAGDTVKVWPSAALATADGVHMRRGTNAGSAYSGINFGTHIMAANLLIPQIEGWKTGVTAH